MHVGTSLTFQWFCKLCEAPVSVAAGYVASMSGVVVHL